MAGRTVYIKEKKNGPGKKGVQWPEAKRLEVVTTYLSCGSLQMTSVMTTVPIDTLNSWKRQPWWKQYIEELQQEEATALSNRLSKVLDKSLLKVEKMLEEGEEVYNPKTNSTVRVPVRIRDAHKISSDLIDKRQRILEAHNKQKSKDENKHQQVTADHLVQLAKAFAEMATGKKQPEPLPPIIEGEYKETLEEIGFEAPPPSERE